MTDYKTKNCKMKDDEAIMLSQVASGTRVRIESLPSNQNDCHRLRELGFCEEAEIRCLSNGDHNIVCEVCNTRIVLNTEIAKQIHVKPLNLEIIELINLPLFKKAKIFGIKNIDSNLKLRLMEMGITKGTDVEILRFAPMGDPIEITLRGYRLSLRKSEAESIMVSKS
ncbi:MAG: FeoA family protein [Bacteroidetes bacterium]|nr:FeoA family protein [Bacteroidota bacterium]